MLGSVGGDRRRVASASDSVGTLDKEEIPPDGHRNRTCQLCDKGVVGKTEERSERSTAKGMTRKSCTANGSTDPDCRMCGEGPGAKCRLDGWTNALGTMTSKTCPRMALGRRGQRARLTEKWGKRSNTMSAEEKTFLKETTRAT